MSLSKAIPTFILALILGTVVGAPAMASPTPEPDTTTPAVEPSATPAPTDTSTDVPGEPAPEAASTPTAEPATGDQPAPYIIRFRDGISGLNAAETYSEQGINVTGTVGNVFPGMFAELTPAQLEALAADPAVAVIEPDGVSELSDTQSGATWGLDRVDQNNLPLSGTYTHNANGTGVRAYVIDSGVLGTHSDFGGRVTPGFSAVDAGEGWTDCRGHGTHVAGTIAGSVYGVAKGATIVPVRVFPCTGTTPNSTVIMGMDWVIADHAAGQPAVANMSLGGTASALMNAAAQSVINDGITLVVSAGNGIDGVPQPACNYSPAGAPAAITVAATDRTDQVASFSNYGSCVDIYGPGVSIVSDWYTSTTATNTLSGTSMATPHVTGAAAVVLSVRPNLSPSQVTSTILSAATAGIVTSAPSGTTRSLLNALRATPTPTFIDVNYGAAFFYDIQWLWSQGITTGVALPDGTRFYAPADKITREAMAAFIYRFMGSPAFAPPTTSPFTDLTPSSAFYREITWLEANGIAPGIGDPNGSSTFRPSDQVTREVMAVWVFRTLASASYTPPATSPFVDVSTSHPSYTEIAWMFTSGLSTGVRNPDGTSSYYPADSITREAMAAFFHRALPLR